MNKQTHSEETLKRTKGIIGDEDKLKSSTENPKKELINVVDITIWIFDMIKHNQIFDCSHKENLQLLNYLIEKLDTIKENLAH